MAAVVVTIENGRTISSFRIELAIEKAKRKPFCSASDKSDRKKFDEMMFGIPRFYISV
jgi:hypothetical protein